MLPKTSTFIEPASFNSHKAFPLLKGKYQLALSNDILAIAADWQQAAPPDDEFLQIPYLSFLESYAPGDLSFCYLVFYQQKKPVGVACCQMTELKISEALTDPTLSPIRQRVNSAVLKVANMKAVFCGNILVTGEHGSYFSEKITSAHQSALIKEALGEVRQQYARAGHQISLLLIKDLNNARVEKLQRDIGKEYRTFSIQPKMVLSVREDWNSFADYLAAMTSKYRVRVRRARKKGKSIIKRELDTEDIKAFLPKIEELYLNIAEQADFNVIKLDGNYFLQFKQNFPDKFQVFGYFLKDKLIAFYTSFLNYRELEAHFLGFDYDYNRSHQVYLNILYDLVHLGINKQVEYINFARTALEIKSSVGAAPVDLFYLGKHTNPLKNAIFSPVLAYFNPVVEWVQRNPFRE